MFSSISDIVLRVARPRSDYWILFRSYLSTLMTSCWFSRNDSMVAYRNRCFQVEWWFRTKRAGTYSDPRSVAHHHRKCNYGLKFIIEGAPNGCIHHVKSLLTLHLLTSSDWDSIKSSPRCLLLVYFFRRNCANFGWKWRGIKHVSPYQKMTKLKRVAPRILWQQPTAVQHMSVQLVSLIGCNVPSTGLLLVGRVSRNLSSKTNKSITVKYRGYSRERHILLSYRSRCFSIDTARGDFRSFTWGVTSEKHSRMKWAVTKAIFTCPVLAEGQSSHAPLRANDFCS